MALQMGHPTKHPKTGICRIRIAVPEHIRTTAKELFGVGRELIANLRTKDPAEAKAAAPRETAKLEERLAAVRAAHEGRPVRTPEQAVQAIAGEFYRAESAKWAADPGLPKTWEAARDYLLNHADIAPGEPGDDRDYEYQPVALEEDRELARASMLRAGYAPTAEAIDRVCKAIDLRP